MQLAFNNTLHQCPPLQKCPDKILTDLWQQVVLDSFTEKDRRDWQDRENIEQKQQDPGRAKERFLDPPAVTMYHPGGVRRSIDKFWKF